MRVKYRCSPIVAVLFIGFNFLNNPKTDHCSNTLEVRLNHVCTIWTWWSKLVILINSLVDFVGTKFTSYLVSWLVSTKSTSYLHHPAKLIELTFGHILIKMLKTKTVIFPHYHCCFYWQWQLLFKVFQIYPQKVKNIAWLCKYEVKLGVIGTNLTS